LGLRQHVPRNEPAGAKLPAVGPNLTGDAYEVAYGPVVARADEQLVVGQEAIDRVDGVLVPHALGGLGGRFALCALDDAEELQAADLHEWGHLKRRYLVRESRGEQPGVLLPRPGRRGALQHAVVARAGAT